MKHWLLKSDAQSFSIGDLALCPGRTTSWDGVRNFQARNMLRDSLKRGDQAFFYHSGGALPGIAGIVRIVRQGYPDATALDPRHIHYDAGSSVSRPRWYVVDVKLIREFKRLITLDELRAHATTELADLPILRRGNRLSVTPVSKRNWDFVLALE
ncbi:MAG TPA: EVE domain-containing protein [Steroidobacteraceae bacterium]|nr:EVE domain-containing protein [Steroidobacteraceae bacterium]